MTWSTLFKMNNIIALEYFNFIDNICKFVEKRATD